MKERNLTEMISLYLDGELNKDEEANLFSSLANDQSSRDYFKQLSLIRNTVINSSEDFPPELEERILRSIGSKTLTKTSLFSNIKIFSAIKYAAGTILLFLSAYLFLKVATYQDRVDNLSRQLMFQSRTIQMLYNSLPGIEVQASFDNEIVIKPNI